MATICILENANGLDWFERLTGFVETDYASTRARLEVTGGELVSLVNGKSYGTGHLELVSLSKFRKQSRASARSDFGQLRVSLERGDVRQMHQRPEFAGALFQVAYLLEMSGPNSPPEDGVTIINIGTQGPASAMAAGAATIYRN
jgi:hypothetical protein